MNLYLILNEFFAYLSPDLLKAQLVNGSKCALNTLKHVNFYS